MTRVHAAWLLVAVLAVFVALFMERRQVIPEPWGYVAYDRIAGTYVACAVTNPDQYLLDFSRNGETVVSNPNYDPKAPPTTIDDFLRGAPDRTMATIPGPFDRAKAIKTTAPPARCLELPERR